MKRLLVALDGSPQAKVVLDEAAVWAQRTGARLVLFRAVGVPTEIPAQAYALPPGSLEDLMQAEARKALEDYARTVGAELVAGVRIGVGSPWRAICDAAKEESAELIVIGSHGYGTLERLLGTTASKVVDHADRSVLVVRKPELGL
jgi:nucleotide-binding universal stress UspA family protein